MPARRRLRKVALWICIAIPALAVMYLGAYYRMVTSVATITISASNNVMMAQRQPRYFLPWPVPVQYNNSQLQPGIEQVFAPAHRMDQWLRPDVWASREVAIRLQADGTGNIVAE
jgi:hypothetical protein